MKADDIPDVDIESVPEIGSTRMKWLMVHLINIVSVAKLSYFSN